MATYNLPFGYIDLFDSVPIVVSNKMAPFLCRLKSAEAGRTLTLINGVAVNVDGTQVSPARYPIEQKFEIALKGTGNEIDTLIDGLGVRLGKSGTLRVRTPGGTRFYTATAILKFLELAEEGDMSDSGENWTILSATFLQMEPWNR